MKIGILYVKGSLPLFEDFGNLPTHTVNQYGLVKGVKAHKVLDGLILPGGSMVESINITPELQGEVEKLAVRGSFILGMCSGFQLLAESTNIGRKSPCPIIKEGMGLLDVTFSPLISNDRVEAEIVDQSFLTKGMIGDKVTGFHCHTYGQIQGEATPLCYSRVRRVNYQDNDQKVLSGVRNDEGNVVGIMLHGSLDENPQFVQNILNYLDATEKDVREVHIQNQKLTEKIRRELGVNTNIFADKINSIPETIAGGDNLAHISDYPPMIMMGSTGSDSG
ncbi:MAG: cobyrinic acid a,c-diamide synthase, partial [Methanobacterium sp.]|nr:cobyrinic acid a,c-diamide synthase [Methanobacterium sp.]